MSDYQRKSSMENVRKDSALNVAKINTTLASLKDFDIPIESWEQVAQDRTKWRYLIRKGSVQYKEKRICEAERKQSKGQGIIISDVTSSSSLTLFATDILELKLA